MTRHGSLKFGFQLSDDEWEEIKHAWGDLIDFDPYEPDWSER